MTRRFLLNINCSSCKSVLDKHFSQYDDIKYSVNIMEKILKVTADPIKYPDEKIIQIIKKCGYDAKKI